jgi:DNA processing protein
MNEYQEKSDDPSRWKGASTVERGDAGYPARLELLSDPPPRIHVLGRLPAAPMVAIVGSRDADAQACRLASSVARELVSHGLVVVSGGARGIDTAAHRGALDAGGETVAVLGSGFAHMYPEGNRSLFEAIAESGAVLTEFDPSTPPTRWTFPRRNRLVAAMASAVVVAQAGERSGALITGRIARELGVPLGAVPGAPGDLRSRGCNRLIRSGATLIEDAADVLSLVGAGDGPCQLGLPGVETRGKHSSPSAVEGLSETERTLLEKLGGSPSHIDDIAAGAGLTASEALAAMLNLELAGLVEDRGGKSFIRVG